MLSMIEQMSLQMSKTTTTVQETKLATDAYDGLYQMYQEGTLIRRQRKHLMWALRKQTVGIPTISQVLDSKYPR